MIVISTAKELAQRFAHLKANQVLTPLYNCKVGIATENEQGYTPTGIKAHTHNYNEARELVHQANAIIHPKIDHLSVARIQASTL